MLKEKGYLCLVLHAHLPFVRHPEYNDFLEEDWLYEAITETYIPLIAMFDRLVDKNIDFAFTMSVTPPLCNMLADPLLMSRYENYLTKRMDLMEKELERNKDSQELQNIVNMYRERFNEAWFIFAQKYNRNLLTAFKKFQDLGKLEIITCGATHGFLPHILDKNSVNAQIKVACDDYRAHFGRDPRGIWLPECAYRQGDDEVLAKNGIKFFFVDTHGIMFGSPQPKHGVYAPVYCNSGVAAFARDTECSKQVWSAEVGYPGDFRYREFYRDLGYDTDYEYIKPYLHEDGVRRNTGIKYHRITGKVGLCDKQFYSPSDAREAAASHAGNFLFNREKQVEYLFDKMQKQPIVVAPYDAELFGHWWYEGPQFLEFLIRKIHYDQDTVKMITPSQYLERFPENQMQMPASSSWGDKGYYEVWLNGGNDWIYRHLHKMSKCMIELADKYNDVDDLQRRALNQAARELLLAQSSDWAFIITTGTMVEYAIKRTKDHINRFFLLHDSIINNKINKDVLSEIEYRDNIFPNIDYKVYKTQQ